MKDEEKIEGAGLPSAFILAFHLSLMVGFRLDIIVSYKRTFLTKLKISSRKV